MRVQAVAVAFDWRSNVSLARETAGVISERVFLGRYAPGQVLAQQRLSEELGVSRTPLREAFALLEHEGVVQLDSYGRATVTKMDITNLREALKFRELLESAACGMAVDKISRPLLADMLQALRNSGTATPHNASKVHLLLLGSSGNRYLQGFSTLVRITEEVHLPATAWFPTNTGKLRNLQVGILECLAESDGKAAQRRVREYFNELQNHLAASERPIQ
ncbi:GntR family transcriptional regulator [Glutamicibacter sp. NPDC055491]|uniref:GntR family transcriptional regulator n=1 Tax=Glutamicibacter sp. NPDC087673 TaxID=3363997 RepID=UPI00380A4C83